MHLNGTILFEEFALNQVHRPDGAQCFERWLPVAVDVDHDFSCSTARAVHVRRSISAKRRIQPLRPERADRIVRRVHSRCGFSDLFGLNVPRLFNRGAG